MAQILAGFRGSERFLLFTALLLTLPALSLCQEPPQQKPVAESRKAGEEQGASKLDIAAIITAGGTAIAAIITAIYSKSKASEAKQKISDVDQKFTEFRTNFTAQLVTPDSVRLIKNEGHFLSEQDLQAFGRILRDQLMQEDTLKVIRLHGGFTTELKDQADRLKRAEQNLLDLDEITKRLKVTIDLQEERKKWEEEVRKRFPQIKPEGGV